MRFSYISSLLFTLLVTSTNAFSQSTFSKLYVRGTFNNWETINPLEKKSESIYATVINVKSCYNEFKIGDAKWSAGKMFAVKDFKNDRAVLGQAIELMPQWKAIGNVVFMPEKTGKFEVSVTYDSEEGKPLSLTIESISDKTTTPTDCSSKFSAPYPLDLYVKGSFNQWDNSSPLNYLGNNAYSADIKISPMIKGGLVSNHEFKISTENWNAKYTFSRDDDVKKPVLLGKREPLLGADGTDMNNITIKIHHTATYRFEFIVDDADKPPTLLVTEVKEPAN